MDNLSQRIQGLSPAKRALLELRLKQSGEGHSLAPTITPRANRSLAAVSFAQQRLWFLDQLELSRALYNVPRAIRMIGTLHTEALQQALSEIVCRHEPFRTHFADIDGTLRQIIRDDLTIPLTLIDLSDLPADKRKTQAKRLTLEEGKRPFDLANGPVIRTSLVRLSEQEHILLLTTHHIVSDAWSAGILFEELGALYEAFSSGKPSPLAPLPIQYADFAEWQRAWLQGEVLEQQLSYWKKQLADAPAVLALPTDRPRPQMQTFRGGFKSLTLSLALSEQLTNLSRREGVTLFMTLLAAFQVLLARYTGQEDVVVGSPIAERNREEIEQLIGFFLNTLVLRTDLSGNPSFRELLGRVREVTLGAYAHQELPFEKLVEELDPERSLSYAPLFQVMFVLQHAPREEFKLSGLSLERMSTETDTSKFDLTLFISDQNHELSCTVEYNTDLFEETTIERLLKHYHEILGAVESNPQRRIWELPLLAQDEREQLLVEWNDTATDYPADKCVHELFEAQVERTPDAIAVVFEDQRLSYGELNGRANQLAHHLRGLGVGPDVAVGLLVERSIEMVVGLLGILKAGGAYVPLDPSYPQERLRFMLQDAEVPVLLTQQRLLESLPEQNAQVVCLDREWQVNPRESEQNPISGADGKNLAYVIYTSGSTGLPKGISLPHTSLVNLLWWHLSTLATAARTLQFASLSFDASFHEMFAAWCSGGSSFIVNEELRPDVNGLARFIAEHKLEKVILPVVVLQQMAEAYADEPGMLSNLREVTTTGEQLHVTRPIVKLFSQLDNCELHNHYGPAETHVVTAYELGKAANEWEAFPPIGKPIANTQIYVLDRHQNPVPVGVVGDLHIGGVSLARGYLNRPEMTAEKFIPDPFSGESGARLYRTGDMARYLPTGDLEYLGRFDHQVKIRGFRVELGEVEAALGQHAEVLEAVIVAREDEPGEKRLVAYVVAGREMQPSLTELRGYLKEKLPEYMVPSAFVILEQMPLTPNGKVDKRALPAPDHSRPELAATFVAPRTAAEEVVAGVWSEVLRVEQVGVYDNFFELGGHSLLATQVVSRIRKALQVELPLRSLFEEPTVDGLVRETIRIWGTPIVVEEIARTFRELELLSEDEVRTMLFEEGQRPELI